MNNKVTQVSIITIGDELLIGQVVDTNSGWMAQQLNKIGISVIRRVAVGDVWDEIWAAIDEEQKHANILLITGGLGPTADDITKPLLCKYFGSTMIQDEKALANVIDIFENKYKRPILERNLLQATVPNNCIVLQNSLGTAPGMWFTHKNNIIISLPGVPHEMKGMMNESVLPMLAKHFTLTHIAHQTLVTAGIGESFLAELLKEFEEKLPKHISLAYLPNHKLVRLRLSSKGNDATQIDKELDEYFLTLQSIVKEYMISNNDEPLEKIVGNLLLSKNATVCTAESCTGGYIAHLLTSINGASQFYDGSVVSYSYQAKEDLLQVDKTLLLEKGAVSEEVVIAMAKGALKNIKSTYVIAVSGIMGPQGGLPDKPVGTVWVAIGHHQKITTHKLFFPFNREKNIEQTATNALLLLRNFIIENNNTN